jgi:hypothetical protein
MILLKVYCAFGWILQFGYYNLETTIWILQFGYYSLETTIWILQFGNYNLDTTIWILQFLLEVTFLHLCNKNQQNAQIFFNVLI